MKSGVTIEIFKGQWGMIWPISARSIKEQQSKIPLLFTMTIRSGYLHTCLTATSGICMLLNWRCIVYQNLCSGETGRVSMWPLTQKRSIRTNAWLLYCEWLYSCIITSFFLSKNACLRVHFAVLVSNFVWCQIFSLSLFLFIKLHLKRVLQKLIK